MNLLDWLIGRLVDWLIDWLIDWYLDWLIDWWLVAWLIDWLIGRLIDWLNKFQLMSKINAATQSQRVTSRFPDCRAVPAPSTLSHSKSVDSFLPDFLSLWFPFSGWLYVLLHWTWLRTTQKISAVRLMYDWRNSTVYFFLRKFDGKSG